MLCVSSLCYTVPILVSPLTGSLTSERHVTSLRLLHPICTPEMIIITADAQHETHCPALNSSLVASGGPPPRQRAHSDVGTYQNAPQLPLAIGDEEQEPTCISTVSSGGSEAEKADSGGETVREVTYR